MIKLLTCGQDWEYYSQFKDEQECLSFIERHGFSPYHCMLEYENGTFITVANLELGREPRKPLMGILPV